jgi:starvation-inducible DNA-binding protein
MLSRARGEFGRQIGARFVTLGEGQAANKKADGEGRRHTSTLLCRNRGRKEFTGSGQTREEYALAWPISVVARARSLQGGRDRHGRFRPERPRFTNDNESKVSIMANRTIHRRAPRPAVPKPVSSVRAERDAGPFRLYATKNDLPENIRREVAELLNARLADCIDLETQCKQAHWNVKGPSFIALHELFDEIHGAVDEYADLIAERIVQLGGIAEGTIGVVARRTTLVDYPLALARGTEHVAALSDALATFGRAVRIGIDEMADLKDADSADVLTEVSRGVDKWLWFVEAHQQ